MIRKTGRGRRPEEAPRPSFPLCSADCGGRRHAGSALRARLRLRPKSTPAPLDLELAVADLAQHLGRRPRTIRRWRAVRSPVELAADIGNVDFRGALELAGRQDLDVLAILQHGPRRGPSTTSVSQVRISPLSEMSRPTISFLCSGSIGADCGLASQRRGCAPRPGAEDRKIGPATGDFRVYGRATLPVAQRRYPTADSCADWNSAASLACSAAISSSFFYQTLWLPSR